MFSMRGLVGLFDDVFNEWLGPIDDVFNEWISRAV